MTSVPKRNGGLTLKPRSPPANARLPPRKKCRAIRLRPPGLALLAAAAHSTFAEQKPIQGDVLLCAERDQEIRMRRRAVLVPVYVLLEYAKVSGELPLRALPTDFSQALGQLLLDSFDGGACHAAFPSRRRRFELRRRFVLGACAGWRTGVLIPRTLDDA